MALFVASLACEPYLTIRKIKSDDHIIYKAQLAKYMHGESTWSNLQIYVLKCNRKFLDDKIFERKIVVI